MMRTITATRRVVVAAAAIALLVAGCSLRPNENTDGSNVAQGGARNAITTTEADWKPVSDALGGQLLVAIPVPDLLLYADGRSPDVLAQLHKVAKEITSEAPNPVFAGVLRWTPAGWDVVAPR